MQGQDRAGAQGGGHPGTAAAGGGPGRALYSA